MGIARKFVLLSLTVVTAMTFGASTASAVEVIEEPPGGSSNGGHCNVTVAEEQASMCNLNLASVGHVEIGGPFGIMINCNITMTGVISESGRFIASSYDVNEPTCEGGSHLHECTSLIPNHRHPSFEPTGTGSFPIPVEFRICFDIEEPLNLGEVECHTPGTVTRVGTGHQYQLNVAHPSPCEGGSGFSISGTFRTPVAATVEVIP